MRFLSDGIGELVLTKLGKAIEVYLAVAFFNPSQRMLGAIAAIPKLKLIVSEEFTITNPYKLEKLKTDDLRSIPSDHYDGRFHAKVLIVKLCNGSYWTLLGSANLTRQGMFSNQEACLALESGNRADEVIGRQIRDWFDIIFRKGRAPDLDQAKLIFDSRSEFQLVPRSPKGPPVNAGYWAIKTTSGSTGESHWPMFKAEHAVAIGWSELPLDPSKASVEELRAAMRKTYPDYSERQVEIDSASIRKFVGLKERDIALICRGYTSKQEKDVHIHGVARITGPFRAEPQKERKWRFKHDAVIQTIDIDLPRDAVASALHKQSLMQTIHSLDKDRFDCLTKELKEAGVHVEV